MKAIVVRQPWATLIATGRKTIETRTWATRHRGDLLVVAGKIVDAAACRKFGWDACVLLTGHAFAVVRVADVRPMEKADEAQALVPWAPKLYAWVLRDLRPAAPFLVKGRLGLFEITL